MDNSNRNITNFPFNKNDTSQNNQLEANGMDRSEDINLLINDLQTEQDQRGVSPKKE